MGTQNPALSAMWGMAADRRTSHLENQIAELKQQLSALQETPINSTGVQRLPTEAFTPLVLPDGLTQPRKYFDPEGMEKLKRSISKVGVQEPLLVRPGAGGKLEIISGERRWRVATELGLEDLPAIPKALSDEDALEIALIANLMRENLNLIEETDSIVGLLQLRLGVRSDEARASLPSILIKIRNQRVRNSHDNKTIAAIISSEFPEYSEILTPDAIAQVDQLLAEFNLALESFVANRLFAIQKMPPMLLDAVRSGAIAFSKADVIRRSGITEAEQQQWLEAAISKGLSKQVLMEQLQAFKGAQQEGSTPAQVDSRIQFNTGSAALRKKATWKRIEEDPKLRRKIDRINTLISELLQQVDGDEGK